MKHDWEYKKLGECFSYIKNGANIKQDKSHIGYPITRIETLSNGVFNRDKVGYAGITELGKYQTNVLGDKDLLMSHINSKDYIGRTVVYDKQGDEQIIHGMNLLRLIPTDILISDYFQYYTLSPAFKECVARIRKDAVNQSSFAISDLVRINIPVPPLPIQQQIVAELDKVSEIIEKKKQQVKELDNLAQSIFYDMFGDPDAIFEKWGQMDLIDVCDKIVDCPHTTPIKAGVPTPYPCIRTSELKGGIIHWDSMQYVFEEEYQKRVSRLIPKVGDIIYGREGSFGDAVILPEGWQFCLGQRTMLFRANNSIVNNSYLHRALISEVVLSQAKDKNVASTVAHVNVKDIKRFKIPIPPLPLQQSFAQKIEAIEKQKELITASIKEAQTLFDARMDYWFGE